jgi:uncharacterized protein YciI
MLVEGPTERETSIIGEHLAYLARLVEKRVVFTAGRTVNTDGRPVFGIVIFEAENQWEAGALMESDPAVSQGVMAAELFPFTVALWASKGPDGTVNGF